MIRFFALVVLVGAQSLFAGVRPEETVRQFLGYCYGQDVPNITELCIPSDDLWMLHGSPQPEKIALLEQMPVKIGASGLFMGLIGQDLCYVELRDGRVNPQLNLEQLFGLHRQVVWRFLYLSLLQDRDHLSGLVTIIDNVSFGSAPKASYGDMDVYADVIGNLPVARTSSPGEDSKSKSVTYRIPLGDEILKLRLVRQDGLWRIDTSSKLVVPLRFFWR